MTAPPNVAARNGTTGIRPAPADGRPQKRNTRPPPPPRRVAHDRASARHGTREEHARRPVSPEPRFRAIEVRRVEEEVPPPFQHERTAEPQAEVVRAAGAEHRRHARDEHDHGHAHPALERERPREGENAHARDRRDHALDEHEEEDARVPEGLDAGRHEVRERPEEGHARRLAVSLSTFREPCSGRAPATGHPNNRRGPGRSRPTRSATDGMIRDPGSVPGHHLRKWRPGACTAAWPRDLRITPYPEVDTEPLRRQRALLRNELPTDVRRDREDGLHPLERRSEEH